MKRLIRETEKPSFPARCRVLAEAEMCIRDRYGTDDEDTLVTFLEEGVPALLAEGEVYLSDAFRDCLLYTSSRT